MNVHRLITRTRIADGQHLESVEDVVSVDQAVRELPDGNKEVTGPGFMGSAADTTLIKCHEGGIRIQVRLVKTTARCTQAIKEAV